MARIPKSHLKRDVKKKRRHDYWDATVRMRREPWTTDCESIVATIEATSEQCDLNGDNWLIYIELSQTEVDQIARTLLLKQSSNAARTAMLDRLTAMSDTEYSNFLRELEARQKPSTA